MFSAPMTHRMEGFHEGFLRKLTNLKAKILRDGLWRKVEAEKVLHRTGKQPLQTYLDKRQATVAEWVDLRPIFNVYTRETGYNLGGNMGLPWWIQAAAEKHLKVTLEDILAATR